MDHVHALLGKNATDQQSPMAVRRIFLTAQQCYAAGVGALQKQADTLPECGRFGQPIVEDVPILVVELFTFRPASKRIPEEPIRHSVDSQVLLDRLLVEVGNIAGVRTRPDIHDHTDPVLPQQTKERFQGMI